MTLLGITAVLLGHFVGGMDSAATGGYLAGIIALALLILCGHHIYQKNKLRQNHASAAFSADPSTPTSSSSDNVIPVDGGYIRGGVFHATQGGYWDPERGDR